MQLTITHIERAFDSRVLDGGLIERRFAHVLVDSIYFCLSESVPFGLVCWKVGLSLATFYRGGIIDSDQVRCNAYERAYAMSVLSNSITRLS